MSWKAINQLLALACIDQEFWQALQKDPLVAIQQQGFDLTSEEQAVIGRITVTSISEFCQCLIDELSLDKHDKSF